MNTEQFDEMCRKRNQIEELRTAVSFICWLKTPKELRAIKTEWQEDSERTILLHCVDKYCGDVIAYHLVNKLEELEKDFEEYKEWKDGK